MYIVNLSTHCGSEPLFETVCATAGNGHRHGPIGASGCGRPTPMRMLPAHADCLLTQTTEPSSKAAGPTSVPH